MERPAPLAVLPFSDPAHALSLLRGLSQLRAERKFLDVTLEAAGGRDFPAHRAVLAAASPYFRAMFAGQLRESRAERVRLHGVPPDMLQLLLDFSYTGRVAVSGDNAEPLLRAADLLQFPAVKEACGAFLQQQLDLANCLDMQDFAEAFSCSGLASAAQRFILRHVGELGAEQLERLPLARLLRYLRDDGLCVPKEEAAYQLALRWVRADPPRRAAHWPQLLEAVRLPFVRRFYLLAHVEAEPLVARCPPCLRLLREARDFQAARYDRHDRGPCPRMRPRPSTGLAEILVLVGGCDQDCDELVTVDCYNPQTGQWRYLAEFPDHLGGGYSIVALGNDIYVTAENAFPNWPDLPLSKCPEAESGIGFRQVAVIFPAAAGGGFSCGARKLPVKGASDSSLKSSGLRDRKNVCPVQSTIQKARGHSPQDSWSLLTL
ncbi:kelch-like 21 [Cricetulus griseus]